MQRQKTYLRRTTKSGTVGSESSLGEFLIAKDANFPHADNEDSDHLRRARMSDGTFSRVANLEIEPRQHCINYDSVCWSLKLYIRYSNKIYVCMALANSTDDQVIIFF